MSPEEIGWLVGLFVAAVVGWILYKRLGGPDDPL